MTAAAVNAALRARGWRMATAESCTAGLIAAAVTEVPGSSEVFDRGFVTYSNAAKITMLDVPDVLLRDHGAVSEPVAKAMATGALRHSDAQIAVAVTGIAGPGGSNLKPEGRVCFGLATKDRPALTHTVEFGAIGRAEVRAATTAYALDLILAACEQNTPDKASNS